MKKVVIATNNKNKIKEISAILRLDGVEFLSLDDLNIDFDVEETGLTFKKNAEKKAVEYYKVCNLPVIAEDSGLEVKVLNGMPGVFSKRIYDGKTEVDGNEIILENLKDESNRKASYVATYCYYDGVNKIFAEGRTYGSIAYKQAGDNGFAYDKIFISDDLKKLMSMASDEEKNSVSHRRRGLDLLKTKIESMSLDEKNKGKKFKHSHLYKVDNYLDRGSISCYRYIDKSKGDVLSKTAPYTCFINVSTGEVLSEDFLGVEFLEEIPFTHIEDYGFSTGLYNSLKRAGINYVEEIVYLWDKEKLLKIKGFGNSRLKELKEKGITLLNNKQ